MLEINKIHNMDCLDGLRLLETESVDCIITDPPYGISYQSARRTDKQERFDVIDNDGQPFVWFLFDSFRVLKKGGAIICFCRWDTQEAFISAMTWAGFKIKSQVVWDRGNHGLGDLKAQFAPMHDVAIFAVKDNFSFPNGRPKSVIRVMRVSADKLVHPTEKPVELIRQLVETLSVTNALILDPFMGSGSTAVACHQTGRNFIGFEISKEYCEIANSRLKQKVLTI